MRPNHVAVVSSHIASIGHDGAETMEVTYKGKGEAPGATYAHTPITVKEHSTIMQRIFDGESAGRIIRNLDVRGVRLGD